MISRQYYQLYHDVGGNVFVYLFLLVSMMDNRIGYIDTVKQTYQLQLDIGNMNFILFEEAQILCFRQALSSSCCLSNSNENSKACCMILFSVIQIESRKQRRMKQHNINHHFISVIHHPEGKEKFTFQFRRIQIVDRNFFFF